MRSFFQKKRMKGWCEVEQPVYATAYEKFGGSVLSHPLTLNAIASVVDVSIQYYAFEQNSDVHAVIPVWERWIAGSKLGLKKMSRKGMVDFGNAELILPISPSLKTTLPVAAANISMLHSDTLNNLKEETEICLAKPSASFSKKVRYNRKRELRLLEEQGGSISSIENMSNEELSAMYIRLFDLRWGFKPVGSERLNDVLTYLRPLIFGSVVKMDGKAIAFQLIYKAECVSHISMEYINGGVDPAYKALSPGSVLTFLNTQQAWALSDDLGKPLRYSFGKADNAYKDRWCNRSKVYSA